MNNNEIINWLFDNAEPVIRYRTATELMDSAADIKALEAELLKVPYIEMLLIKNRVNSLK